MKAFCITLVGFLCIWAGTSSYAQPLFDKLYSRRTVRNLTSCSISPAGGYFMAGEKYSESSNTGINLYLLKVDATGAPQWIQEYGGNGNEYWGFITPCKQGGHALAGVTYTNTAGWDDAYVVRVDEEGNELWSSTIGGVEAEWVRSIIETEDGGFVVCGETVRDTADLSQFWIFKLSAQGDFLWEKIWGGPSVENLMDITQLPNQDFLVTGYTRINSISHFYLARLTPQGDTVWTKKWPFTDIGEPGSIPTGFDIHPTPEGTFLIGGWPVIEVDGQGEILWMNPDKLATKVSLADDGTVLLARQSWIFKLDRQGNILEELEYPGVLINDLKITPDGGWFISGGNLNGDGIRYLKTNCHGELVQDWTCTPSAEINPEIPDFSISVSPNPTNWTSRVWVKGQLPQTPLELLLTDAQGRKVKRQLLHSGINELNLEKLAPGLYHYRAANQVGKIVVQK